jgi:hypothetical protein
MIVVFTTNPANPLRYQPLLLVLFLVPAAVAAQRERDERPARKASLFAPAVPPPLLQAPAAPSPLQGAAASWPWRRYRHRRRHRRRARSPACRAARRGRRRRLCGAALRLRLRWRQC